MPFDQGAILDVTDAERALREAVSGIASAFGPGYYQQEVDDGGYCADLWSTLAGYRYVGIHLPTEYGGGGLGLRELSIVVEETAMQGVPVIALLFSSGVIGTILERSASQEQKARWLPEMATGEARVSFALTEPAAGANSHRIATRAERRGNVWALSGEKIYITGAESARWLMVVARTGSDRPNDRAELSVFMVDASAPGIVKEPIRTTMNQPDQSWRLFFDDVEIPAENLVGPEGRGLSVAFTGMNTERTLTSSLCTGIGRYALRKAAAYASERRVWDVPIGGHQAVAHPLAAAHIAIQAALLMCDRACRLYDSGMEVGELANMAKYLGSRAGLQALEAAISTHGGNSVAFDYQLAPYFWIVRMLNMAPVSNELVLNFVAEHSLGLPRSY